MLRTALRVMTLIAWIGCTFSHAYSRLLLFFYGGGGLLTSNPEAAVLLRMFAAYLVFLAWNGPTEAFMNAAMTTVSDGLVPWGSHIHKRLWPPSGFLIMDVQLSLLTCLIHLLT